VAAVVSEATYGDTTLPNRKEQVRELIATLRTVLTEGGRVLIPTFALGRAQELILLLANHQAGGLLPPVPIYLDGLVRTLTAAYQELLPELPARLRSFAQNAHS
jgi:Cft2 family RNA processing exonuclease